jgi:hypothetical protein
MDLIDWLLDGTSLTSIDELNDDALGLVLREVREYKPVLALVCRRWAAAAARAKIPKTAVLRASGLAARGHAALLQWLRALWPFYRIVHPKMVSKAAAGGHLSLCFSLMAEWDVPESDKVLCLVKGAAIRGDVQALSELLDWMRACGRGITVYDLCQWGARGGHAKVCQFARSLGSTEFALPWNIGTMLRKGASRGHEAFCRQIAAWSASTKPHSPAVWMLHAAVEYDAARGGTRMCDLARELGASDMNEMLDGAAIAGSELLCLKAREWGACNIEGMLFGAADGHHIALCRKARELLELAKGPVGGGEWGDGEWEGLVEEALELAAVTTGGRFADQEAVCQLLVEWGVSPISLFGRAITDNNARLAWFALELDPSEDRVDYNEWVSAEEEGCGECPLGRFVLGNPEKSYDELLYFGMSFGTLETCYDLCKAALAGGARHVDWLLCASAYYDAESLCELAVRHGARDFNGMLMAACVNEHSGMIALAQKWGATASPRPAADLIQVRSDGAL